MFRVLPVKDYTSALIRAVCGVKTLYFAEEGIETGGISRAIVSELALAGSTAHMCVRAVADKFLPHGSYEYILKHCGLDAESIAIDAMAFMKKNTASMQL